MLRYSKSLKFEIELFAPCMCKSLSKIYYRKDLEDSLYYLFLLSDVLCNSSVQHDRQIYTKVRKWLLKESKKYIKKENSNLKLTVKDMQDIIEPYMDWLAEKINHHTYDCYVGDKQLSKQEFDVFIQDYYIGNEF